ncbi:MAG: ABC transporter permease [Armatimonadota bacterium]|nr:ABC transporter permease [Armatimonadota bacterium]MDR7433024.1 ABC transporter permease [Armatimonadota bacterium]MDR7530620.1 ABC transporter permease [Armatimonadota bacterium]MDR7568959.1 ABC transporter permease [Armatimonadota bacterium]MDR7599869.1 ABC transporter permease [Armatimonadota bacterium]
MGGPAPALTTGKLAPGPVLALLVAGGMLSVAVLGDLLAPHGPRALVGPPLSPPGPGFPLGTDELGQDLWSLWCHGTRNSLYLGLSVGLASTASATAVALLSAGPEPAGRALAAFTEVAAALPPFFSAMLLVAFLGPGLPSLTVGLTCASWAAFARVLRTQVRLELQREYVLAARALGAEEFRVVCRHVLPGLAPLLWTKFLLTVRWSILMEATLGLVGVSDPLRASWGAVLGSAFAYPLLFTGPTWLWWAGPPVVSVAVLTWSLAVLGEHLERALDPRTRAFP